MPMETSQHAEAGEVDEVDAMANREGRHAPGPTAAGAAEPVDQHQRLALPDDTVWHRLPTHLHVMLGPRDGDPACVRHPPFRDQARRV
jgi:hypothetical protein